MRVLLNIIKVIVVCFLLIIIFNRVVPYFLEKSESQDEELSDTKIETSTPEVRLPNEMGEIKARPIEYGNWLVYLSDEDAFLEEAFNEQGMLTCDPEFELLIKYKIKELRPDAQLEEALIDFSLDCSGYYEIHLKDKELVQPIFELLEKLYQSKETLNYESADFKKRIKTCLSGAGKMDSFICSELEKNPLPTPEPRYLQQEDGKDVPMKGFSECYDRIISKHQADLNEKVIQDAKLACYSSW